MTTEIQKPDEELKPKIKARKRRKKNKRVMKQPVENTAAVVKETPAEAPSEAPEAPEKPTKVKRSYRKIMTMIAGFGLIALSLIPVIIYFIDPVGKMVLGGFGIFGFIAGGIIAYMGLKSSDDGVVVVSADGKKKKVTANSLVIAENEIAFIDSKLQPNWQRRKCRNDGKYYFVYIQETNPESKASLYTPIPGDTKKFRQFVLPDTQYRDPREFANNLNIPAHRKLAVREASLMQKIAPFALVAAIGLMILLIIATQTPPQTPGPAPVTMIQSR